MSDDMMPRVLAALERLVKGQDQLRTDLIRTRPEIMERIDRLQDALTPQHQGEIVTLGVAERAERDGEIDPG